MGSMVSQNSSLTIVYSTGYSGSDQRKHQKLRVTDLCVGNSPEFSIYASVNWVSIGSGNDLSPVWRQAIT